MASERTKVQELAIFTVGIGVVVAALTIWLTFALTPPAGQSRFTLFTALTLLYSAVLITLGILTGKLKRSEIILASMVAVSSGFLLDLAIGFNIIKAVIVVLVVVFIVKSGSEALSEVKRVETPE